MVIAAGARVKAYGAANRQNRFAGCIGKNTVRGLPIQGIVSQRLRRSARIRKAFSREIRFAVRLRGCAMIYSLRGKLVYSENNKSGSLAVIECAGVGYACKTTNATLNALVKEETSFVFTYLSVRETAVELFGFGSREELAAFKMLISVSGVGPKAALSVLSSLSPQDFALCVASGNFKRLTEVKGLGAKTAQRIVVDLKDKAAKECGMTEDEINLSAKSISVRADSKNISEAKAALIVLGFSAAESVSVLSELDRDLPVQELIKLSLKRMSVN